MTEFMVRGIKIGNVISFDWRFMRAEIGLSLSLRPGDYVQFVGPETDFRQEIDYVEWGREKVKRGKSGQKVWVAVEQRVRPGDAVVIMPKSDDTG